MPRSLIFPAKVMVRLRDERDRIGKVLRGDEVNFHLCPRRGVA